MTIVVLGTAPERKENRAFALFAVLVIGWTFSAMMLRTTFLFQQHALESELIGTPFTWYKLTAIFLGLASILSLRFTLVFLKIKSKRLHILTFAGALVLLTFYFIGNKLNFFTKFQFTNRGTFENRINFAGWIAIAIVLFFLIYSFILLWRNRNQAGDFELSIGMLLLIIGISVGGVINVPIPFMSIMNALSMVVMSHAVIRRQIFNPLKELNVALQKENETRKHAEDSLSLSLAEKEILLKEVHHRVKNNLQIISSLLSLQSSKAKDPGEASLLKESQDRVFSIALIHQQLYQSSDLSRIDFESYTSSLVRNLCISYGINLNEMDNKIDCREIELPIDIAIPCGLIINEMIVNALKHGFPESIQRKPKLSVSFKPHGTDQLQLIVSDNGVGFSDEIDFENSDSLGFALIKQIAERQLAGTIDLKVKNGVTWKITFPKP